MLYEYFNTIKKQNKTKRDDKKAHTLIPFQTSWLMEVRDLGV